MAARKIVMAGDTKLRRKNKLVRNLNSPEIKKIIKDLIATNEREGLIGIAANQIGENYQIFVTHPTNTPSRKLGRTDKVRVYINPQIIFKSKKENIFFEGCGSVANGAIFGPVSRPEEVEVEAIDEAGRKFRLRANGILARVIQHEYDHLQNIEFIQKINDYSKVVVKAHYRKNIKNSNTQLKNSLITKIDYKII